MSVFCIEEASPSTPYADTQPWQVYSKRRIKPYTKNTDNVIPTREYQYTRLPRIPIIPQKYYMDILSDTRYHTGPALC